MLQFRTIDSRFKITVYVIQLVEIIIKKYIVGEIIGRGDKWILFCFMIFTFGKSDQFVVGLIRHQDKQYT